MKLHLPHLLLTALIAASLGTTATADTVIASGVSYDVGKAHPFYSGIETVYGDDHLHCWATAASNVIQNWQDKYSGNAVSDNVPNGIIASPEGAAEGTVNLAVYKTILEHSGASNTDSAKEAYDWWFANKVSDSNKVLTEVRSGDNAVYYNIFTEETAKTFDDKKGGVSYANIVDAFQTSGGMPVTLDIHQTGSTIPYTDALGEHRDGGESRYHNMTCWGYETDSDGNISALFLSDSDDKSYGIFKAQAGYRDGYNSVLDMYFGDDGKTKASVYLDTDDAHDGYNGNFEVAILSVGALITPEAAILNADAPATAADTLGVSGEVTQNTNLSREEHVTRHGVVVGNPEAGKLVILSTDNAAGLELEGQHMQETGLTVENGSVASLANLDVSGYNDGAMSLTGRGYLHDGSVSITDNHATNGAAANTSTYLEIEGNSEVTISGNTATEKGGAIYNTGTVSLFGNDAVTFSGNTASADGGMDIYNAKGGIINIYNNNAVEFKSGGNGASVRNEGKLYIAAEAGHDVTFVDTSLDSRGGTVYIGTDLSGDAINTTGGLTVRNEDGTSSLQILAASEAASPHQPQYVRPDGSFLQYFTHFKERTPAMLENVTVSVDEINGVAASESAISGAIIDADGNLKLTRLSMDTSTTLSAKSITMDSVVFDLSQVQVTKDSENTYSYDLSSALTASSVAMVHTVFDLSGLELGADDKVVVNLGDTELTGTSFICTADGLRSQHSLANGTITFLGSDALATPEPTTATLSLLTLVALAARRKRSRI